jgi:hypothetical protein
MRRLLTGSLIAAALLVTSATQGEAQSYAQQVWSQLQKAHDAVGASDFVLQNYIIGHLGEGNTDTWSFPMRANTEYIITGACDTDCSDLDITIKDASGKVVEKDTTTDDVPVVRFTPGSNAKYTVEVKMYSCSSAPCYFGFGVFQKK